MKITIKKVVEDNKYSAEMNAEFDGEEQNLSDKFGEPLVEFGGDITGPPAFTLATVPRAMVTGTPYTFSIDGNGDSEAKDKVNAWVVEVRARMVAALTTLEGNTDDFTGETIETV
jgi:hypothetical protein